MVGSHRRESRVWLSVQPGPHKLLSHHTALHVSQENWGLLMCVLLVGLLLPRMALGTGHLRRHSLRLPSSAGARTLWFASAPVTVSSTRPNPKEPRTVQYTCTCVATAVVRPACDPSYILQEHIQGPPHLEFPLYTESYSTTRPHQRLAPAPAGGGALDSHLQTARRPTSATREQFALRARARGRDVSDS